MDGEKERLKMQTTKTLKQKPKVTISSHSYSIVDNETGEVTPASANIVCGDRDFNFTKVWTQGLLMNLGIISSQKLHVALWLLMHANRENMVIGTVRGIAKQAGSSEKTAFETIKALESVDLIRRVANGLLMVNPDKMFKGTHSARMAVATVYQRPDTEKPSLKKQIAETTKQIQQTQKLLQQQVSQLTKLNMAYEAEQAEQKKQAETKPIREAVTA